MRVNYVVILIVIAALAAVYLYAQEPESPEEEVTVERIAEIVESMKGNWTMFNGEVGGTFLYNKNTGAVYKFWSQTDTDGNFSFGFQRATILNRNQPLPSSF